MLPSYFDYFFIHLRQKQVSGPNEARNFVNFWPPTRSEKPGQTYNSGAVERNFVLFSIHFIRFIIMKPTKKVCLIIGLIINYDKTVCPFIKIMLCKHREISEFEKQQNEPRHIGLVFENLLITASILEQTMRHCVLWKDVLLLFFIGGQNFVSSTCCGGPL